MFRISPASAVIGLLSFVYPCGVEAQDLLVAVQSRHFASAESFLARMNSNAALQDAEVRLVAVPDDEIAALPRTSDYMLERGYTFVLSPQVSDLLVNDRDEAFAFTALLSEPTAFTSFEQQQAVAASVLGDIAEIELGSVNLIAVSDWPTPPSVVVARGLFANASDLQGLRVVANSPSSYDAITNLGASPVSMPIGEISQSLEAGFADAFVATPETAADTILEWKEGSVFTGLELPQGYLLAELEAWVELDEFARQAVRTAANAVSNEERNRQIEIERSSIATWASFGGSVNAHGEPGSTDLDELKEIWEGRYGTQGQVAVDLLREVVGETDEPQVDPGGNSSGPSPKVDPIAFITNRVDQGGSDPSRRFGARRDANAGLTCGLLDMVDPRERSFGKPYKGSIVSASNSEAHGAENCVELLERWLGEQDKLVIFFHGFNNTFDAAVRRAAAYKFDAADGFHILIWSWPSLGDVGGYLHDARSVTFTRRELEPFVKALLGAGLGPRTTVLAHSMGSMVAIDFVEFVNRSAGTLDGLFLVAPDVPRTLFDAFNIDHANAAPDVTLYANAADRALATSMVVNRERPVGLGGSGRYLADEIETIDVTGVAGSRILWRSNHSHAFDIPAVALDMSEAIRFGRTAIERGLTEINEDGGTFYKIDE